MFDNEFLEEEWRANLTDKELAEINEHNYAWLDYLSDEELNEYNNSSEAEDDIYIKSSEDDQEWIRITDKSILHPDNPHYQKINPRWDWVEIKAVIKQMYYKELMDYLDKCADLELHSNYITYWEYNLRNESHHSYYNKRSNFRVLIQKYDNEYKITMNISSILLNQPTYTDRFKHIRLLLNQQTIRIQRLDLSFLLLLDATNLNMSMKYAKKREMFMSEDMDTETITLGSRKSPVRAILYNKKVQLVEKKKRDLDNIEHLYNLEFTFTGEALKKWDSIIQERLILEKNIISYYEPKKNKKTDFALMYLFLNNRPLFKQRFLSKDERKMKRHLDELKEELKKRKIDFDLVPLILEAFGHSKNHLVKKIYDLTGIEI